MNDEARLNHFFSVLREKRKAFADNYAYFAPKLAPRFNSFNFIRPDELKLSEILAMLLNPLPKAVHAQGDLFLRLFFSEININYPNTTNIKVGCEVATDRIENTARRIDIEIDFAGHFGLAIENKPWANDQDKQLSDYAKQMQCKYSENWCLIYLSGDDSDPNEGSATSAERATWEANDQYRKLNFSHIVTWLKNCEAQCQADHVRHFLRDFIGYCQNKFLGEANMVDAKLINDFVLKDKENLKLAFAIRQQIDSIKADLFQKFLTDLEQKFNATFPDWKFDRDKDLNYKTSRGHGKEIRFKKPSWIHYSFCIGFDVYECGQFYWAISKKDKVVSDLPENTVNKLNDELNKSGKSGPSWAWWCYFPEPYYDWRNHAEPWLEIQSGELAKMVIGEIVKLKDASESIIDVEEVLLSKTGLNP